MPNTIINIRNIIFKIETNGKTCFFRTFLFETTLLSILFVFPALFVAILGPAVINIFRILIKGTVF